MQGLSLPLPRIGFTTLMSFNNFYNIDHLKLGIALIFNHNIFYDVDLEERCGSKKDTKDLAEALKGLGFIVRVYEDLRANEIKSTLENGE